MAKLMPHVEAFRMPGAPSMMACSVAAGRYDITSFLSPRQEPPPGGNPFPGQPWETCAFVLLVQEAGGAVQRFGGGPPDLLGHNAYAAHAGAPRSVLRRDAFLADHLSNV